MKLPYTRREFAKLALTALPTVGLFFAGRSLRAADPVAKPPGKPNSKFAGVQVGLNVPYSFGGRTMAAEEILKNCQELNLSAVELRAQPVEGFLGLPPILVATRIGTSNARTAPDNNTVKIREWRRTVSMDRVREFRRIFEDGGVNIEILKVDDITKMTDEEIDYNFAMAKALGARAISTEIPRTDKDVPEEIAALRSQYEES